MTDVLPPLFERVLDDAGLDALIADLRGSAQVIEVRTKASARSMSSGAGPADVAVAIAQLRGGDARAVQVIYGYRGEQWSDTILYVDAGCYRVVRVATPRA